MFVLCGSVAREVASMSVDDLANVMIKVTNCKQMHIQLFMIFIGRRFTGC